MLAVVAHHPLRFFFNAPAPTEIYTLSLHDALPIFIKHTNPCGVATAPSAADAYVRARDADSLAAYGGRSEEHTSELQSRRDLVCRLLLEKKKIRRSGACRANQPDLALRHLLRAYRV